MTSSYQHPKTVDAMPQSPCGLLGCPVPTPIRSTVPINLWNFQTWKFHHASSIAVPVNFCILKRFVSTEQSKIISVASCQTRGRGCKAKNWGRNCTPCFNAEPPLHQTDSEQERDKSYGQYSMHKVVAFWVISVLCQITAQWRQYGPSICKKAVAHSTLQTLTFVFILTLGHITLLTMALR